VPLIGFSGRFVPTGIYACNGEFYDVPWGGFQEGLLSLIQPGARGVLPFLRLESIGEDIQETGLHLVYASMTGRHSPAS
jgi:hypothetical protein